MNKQFGNRFPRPSEVAHSTAHPGAGPALELKSVARSGGVSGGPVLCDRQPSGMFPSQTWETETWGL